MAISTINLSSLNGNNSFRMDGAAAYDHSGFRLSDAGDVNGDGFADVILSASGPGFGPAFHYVVFGKASGFDAALDLSSLDGNNGFRVDPTARFGNSGNLVSSAGDVNGDGFADLLVGAPYAGGSNGYYAGSSYVVFGKAAGFDATLNLSALDGSNGFRLDGVAAYDFSGSVSNAGDVNGDGFSDLLVGAVGADPNGNYAAGSGYVVFGKAGGFDATMNLASLDGNNGFRLDGEAAYDRAGSSVSSAGDVNGDGFADLMVGATGADPNGSYSGSSYVVFGKAGEFNATLDLSTLNGNNGFRLDGTAANDLSGFSLSSAGDVNGDGFADLLVGAPNADGPNGRYAGSSYVVFGKAAGFDATLNLSALDGSNGFRLDGAAYDGLGHSVSSAGDVNGDGFADLLVAAPGARPNGPVSGSTYVVFGKAAGFDATLNLSSLDSNSGFRLDGAAYDFSSFSVSSAGDVNGDGFADLMVSSPGADPNGSYSGSSYVVFGGNFNGAVTALGTAGADKLKGSKAADRMVAGDGDDTLIGRGGADVFHAGAGNDAIEIRDANFQLVDGGAGYDTLKLDRSHMDLDLSSVHGRINDIEAIDMKGNGHNTLTLNALDVLNLSSTSNTLTVDGNNNDSVLGLSNDWTDGGIDDGYHTFTNGAAVVLVGVHVMTDFV